MTAERTAWWYVVGVGVASGATPSELRALVDDVLRRAEVDPRDVRAVATADHRRRHPAVTALGWPVLAFGRDELVGGVAEPAALRVTGPTGTLVVAKVRSARATAALACAAGGWGQPGGPEDR